MGSPSIIDILDKYVSIINNATFSAPFASVTAVRAYYKDFDREAYESLIIRVVPEGKGETDIEITPISRSQDQYDYPIEVGIQKQYSDADNTEADELVILAGEMLDIFRFGGAQLQASTGGPNPTPALDNKPVLMIKGVRPLFDFSKQKEQLIFSAVLRLVIRVVRKPT